jgi:hypothetical protein
MNYLTIETTNIVKDEKGNIARAIKMSEVVRVFNTVMKEHGLQVRREVECRGYTDSFMIEVERSFSVGCHLSYRNDWSSNLTEHMEKIAELNPQPNIHILENRPVIEIGWSGTSRSIPECVSAIDLYQKMVAAASEFQSLIQSYSYIVIGA